MAMLYGQLPKVDVSREYADADDDTARVASLILHRMLNNCVADPGDDYVTLLKEILQDRLVPGLGCARIRYDFYTEDNEIPAINGTRYNEENGEEEEYELAAGYTETVIVDEDCPVDYVHWRDVRWGYSRTWADIPWIAFRSFLTKKQVKARWGEKVAKLIRYSHVQASEREYSTKSTDHDPEPKAKVWEIWHKVSKKVFWWSEGYDKTLEDKKDTLRLDGFWPCPPFFAANITTTSYIPTPDFYIAQDLYNEIDRLQSRISKITEAVKVVGVYDKSAEGVQRMFQEGIENDLIPVDNWAMFAEKGGIAGQIDWLPIKEVAEVLGILRGVRDETISLLYQVTGMSDILRGAGSTGSQRISAAEQQLKAQFGSVIIQAMQDEFAQFASDLMRLKAEVISKHYSPETIIKQSNIMHTADAQHAQKAIELIKQPDMLEWRINVRPETVAMVDYAQLRAERTEYLTALATFMQSSAPLIEKEPAAAPFLTELMKWGLAGFKGSREIEGVIDRALEAMSKPKEQEQDPQAEADAAKQQAEMQKIQLKMQQDQQKHQMEMERITTDHQQDMQKMMADFESEMLILKVTTGAKVSEEEMQAYYGILEEREKTALKIVASQEIASHSHVD